jgi:hypothetical protein
MLMQSQSAFTNFPEEITPILTRKMKDRGQVDLVDMQGQQYHGYK